MGVEQSLLTADHDDAAPVDDTISGIAIKGASQHASPNMGLSRIARSASNTSLPVSEDTGDYTIRGAAAAQKSQNTENGAREEQQRILDQSNSTLNLDASIPRASTLETSSRDAPDDVSSVGEATTTSSIPRCKDNIRPVQRPPDATTELVFGKSIEVSGAPVPRSPPPIQSPSTHREFYRQAPTPEAALSPTHEIDGMTDDAARNSLSEKHAPPASLKLQDKHYDEADELAQQSFTGPHKPTCPADDGGQKPKKPIFVRKKVLKPAQECNVISSNKDPQISAPAVAHPHLQESTISNVSLQRDIGGVSPREMSRTATNPRSDPDSIELGEGSTKKTSEDGTTAAIPKITQPFPEYPSQQAEKARSESRMEVMLPEIPESPSEPRRDDHNTRSEPEVASEKGKDAARARLTSQTARRTKFQHRSCSDCGIIVSTKSSVARFSCLSCQEAPKIASPASGAVEQPGKGPRAEGECRPSQEQIAQLDVHEADIVGQLVTEMPDDGDLTHTATATEPSPDSAAAIKNTVGPSCAESRKVTASPALGEVAGTASSQQARRARGKHNTHPYHRMIGMALCDRGPLQAKAIAAWIVENVPGMDGATEKGSMLGNVSGIVSLNVNRKGKQLFKYRPWKAGDSTEFGAGTWIELQPDKLDKHDRWDPVLKEPVSPPRALKEQSVNTGHGLEASHSGTKPSSAVLAGSKTCTQSDSEGQRPSISPNIDTPRPALEDDESSDEEPLSKIRPVMRRGASAPAAGMLASTDDNLMETGRTPVAAMKASTSHTPALKSGGILDSLQTSHPVSQLSSHQASPLPDLMDIDPDDASRNGASAAQKPATGRSHDVRPNCEPLGLQVTAEEARGKTVEEIIELDSKLVTHSVNSLYVDWPEYAPENHIDKRAIMAEIKKRPTRKQMFGKPACYSRLAGSVNQAELTARFVEQTTSKHSLREAPQSKASDGGKENIKQFDSLEDFFGLPKDPLAILVDGKLAYRDGTRNEDGELLQAKTIYRTGL
ncbi:hypothetical protein EJ03DRAFT_349643 [Teratosphaeria nubilosa]|uniref:Fork-head domain-containing protein n=1 Tax=Teratosphaeria nubilosa TaxID=161662 RepID=A0A6G1LF32_9PEZI|nr:hypothetical protein EJ03DRAFT_349643 [Teratosphaeria nubilosa]